MQLNNVIIQKISSLPAKPGIYIFKDAGGKTLYIGKAKSLRKRVQSYQNKDFLDWKAESLAAEAHELEHQIVTSEVEALLLEAKLIQLHQPKFNILLKSGSPFVYFLFTQDKLPKLEITRNRTKAGFYAGPFLSSNQARTIFDIIIKVFNLKVCSRKIESGCLYYHMDQCSGSCRPDFNLEHYKQRLTLAKNLCKKGPAAFVRKLNKEIREASAQENFEQANKLNQYLQTLEENFEAFGNIRGISHIRLQKFVQTQIWIFSQQTQVLYLFAYANGNLRKQQSFLLELDGLDETPADYVHNFYRQALPPGAIFTNFNLPDKRAFTQFLTEWHHLPEDVVLQDSLSASSADFISLAQAMSRQEDDKLLHVPSKIQALLFLKSPAKIIDCFDISHHQGQFLVGACVRYSNGKPDKNAFRRFKIKFTQGIDDYRCLQEVVTRRYSSDITSPDLVLIDGGKGQLNAVKNLFPSLEFAALAKKEERIFRPQNSEGSMPASLVSKGKILSTKNPEGLTLISLRDYTHHFAISYHRLLKKST